MLLIPFGVLRLAWTASAAAARTRTWPMARRSWRPSPCQRKLWSRPGSRWASTSPVSPQRPCAARPPAPRATPSSTSPQPRGRLSRPPSYLGRGTTTGAMTIRWRCGLTVEVRPPLPRSVVTHIPPPLPPPPPPLPHPAGWRHPSVRTAAEPEQRQLQWQAAARVTSWSWGGALHPNARNCTMLVVLHTEKRRRKRRCSVTVCAEISFQWV